MTVHDLTSDDTGAYDAKITGLPVSYDGAISTSTRVEVEETPVVLVKQLSVRSSEDEVAEGGQACLSACLSKPGVQVSFDGLIYIQATQRHIVGRRSRRRRTSLSQSLLV